jgi:bifunctional UDP-N-acetylglucosamine pyrophosphorylase / glucosamine-1-phosphate N-acetyltransferase
VAPVTIGDGAMTGGGTVVRRDVPPGNLAVSGGPQRNLDRRTPRESGSTSMGEPAADEGESGG